MWVSKYSNPVLFFCGNPSLCLDFALAEYANSRERFCEQQSETQLLLKSVNIYAFTVPLDLDEHNQSTDMTGVQSTPESGFVVHT